MGGSNLMSAIAGRVLLIPKGNYDSTATYTMLDMVVYNGSSYICKQECTGVVPTNTTYWMLNASGSAVAYINDIGDVVITNVSNGQVLMYDSTTQKWVNGTITTTLAGLTDTQIASLSNGQVLKYNSTSQKWENADEKGGILPHLIVISETGSTVTATKGQTVITATETSIGHFECDLTEFGTWTIDAILGGDDAQVSLVVDTVKVYTVDDSHFHATVTVKYPDGATCRLQSADETLYATSSPYTFTVHHAETYTITVTYNQRIYTDTVTFTTEGQSFSKTLPSPSEVDANDINMWLFFGDVSGTFSTLSDILGNSTALSMLMASTDAVDYLVRCTEWIKSNALVPVMTSDTTPSGEAFASSIYSDSYNAYKAFDGISSTSAGNAWQGVTNENNSWIAYDFTTPKKIGKVIGSFRTYQVTSGKRTVKIQGSNNRTTWEDETLEIEITGLSTASSYALKDFEITNFISNTAYRYHRLQFVGIATSSASTDIVQVAELQFYTIAEGITENQSAMSYIGLNNYCANTLLADSDWLDGIANSEYIDSVLNVKVPTMTSATTPSGECSADSYYSSSGTYLYPWKAFDGDSSSTSTMWSSNKTKNSSGAWIQYDFGSSKKIYFIAIIWTNWTLTNCDIKGSNDGTTFTTLGSYSDANTDIPKIFKHILENIAFYRYLRLVPTSQTGSNTYAGGIVELQFYGREDV